MLGERPRRPGFGVEREWADEPEPQRGPEQRGARDRTGECPAGSEDERRPCKEDDAAREHDVPRELGVVALGVDAGEQRDDRARSDEASPIGA